MIYILLYDFTESVSFLYDFTEQHIIVKSHVHLTQHFLGCIKPISLMHPGFVILTIEVTYCFSFIIITLFLLLIVTYMMMEGLVTYNLGVYDELIIYIVIS